MISLTNPMISSEVVVRSLFHLPRHLNKQCRTKQHHGPESCTTPHQLLCRDSRILPWNQSPTLPLKKWFLLPWGRERIHGTYQKWNIGIWWNMMEYDGAHIWEHDWNMYNIGNWCNTVFPTMRWNQEPISAPRSQTQQCSLGYPPKFGRSILITPPRPPLKPTSGYTVWCLPPLPFFVGFILGFISFIPLSFANLRIFQAVQVWYYQQHWAPHHFLQLLV